jgi:ATP-dependent protease ClpP protease subunit
MSTSAPAVTPPAPQTITDLYAVFCGDISPHNAQIFAANLCGVSNTLPNVKIHLLLHSYGGNVADGIFIYN